MRKLYGHSIVDMKTVFASFDEDGDGTIDRMELDAGLTRLGLPSTPLLIESVFDAFDDLTLVDLPGIVAAHIEGEPRVWQSTQRVFSAAFPKILEMLDQNTFI